MLIPEDISPKDGEPVKGRPFDANADRPGMRVCAICDGFDALLRMSAWLVHLPAAAIRTDLGMVEALEHLQKPADRNYDQIIIAPDTGKSAAPKLVAGVMQAAAARCGGLVVLLPPGARLQLPKLPGTEIHYGPPFAIPEEVNGADPPPPEAAQSDQTAPAGRPSGRFFSRFMTRRSGRNAGASPSLPVPELPSQPCRLISFQPVSGGAGATTIAVNLAVGLATRPNPPEICLIDLNLQFGNAGTYLDLPTNTRVTDAYRQIATLDYDSFQTCLNRVNSHLRVFAAPAEILPVDGITEGDLRRILSLARDCTDLVLLDLPHLVTDWSGAAWAEADAVFTVSRADVRSAQNMLRLMALIRAERLAEGRLFHLLNKVPARPDAAWTAALNSFETGLDAAFFRQLPDGGEAVVSAGNSGIALAQAAPANPLSAALSGFCDTLAPKIGRRRHSETGGA